LLVKFLLLQCGNKGLNQGDALPRLLRGVHEKSMVAMLLEFLGLFTKRAANALTELQLCSGYCRVDIRETFPAKILHLRKEFLEISGDTGELFNSGGFGARTDLF
jgi:hypothetical protein